MINSNLNYNDPQPLYKQVENDLKDQIVNGILKADDSIGSQSVLADKYKVSIITIKKALLNLTDQGYLYSRVGRGTYVSNRNQKDISHQDSKTIGLVLRDLKHPFFSMIVNAIEEKANSLNFNIILSSSYNNPDREENQINYFKKIGVDGFIIASLSLEYRATSYIRRLHEENFPYVLISYIHDPEFWYVGSEQEKGAFIAADHLINIGYKKIGYVNIEKGNVLGEIRKNGYARALFQANLPFKAKYIYNAGEEIFDTGSDRFGIGYEFGKKFLKLRDKPEALCFYNDNVALGFMQYLNDKGKKIPEDVAVVGFDDVEIARYSSTPLSTIRQPVQKIGETAVEIINNRIEKRDIANRITFKPELVVRDSCGAFLKKTKKQKSVK